MKLEEELFWFNQKYLVHKDNIFNSNGTIDISTSCNTQDFQNFSSPTFNIAIFNDKSRYSVNLKYQDVLDLLLSIKEVLKNINEIYSKDLKAEIIKTYNSKFLKILFKKSKVNQEKGVLINILNTQTDFGVIVLHYNIFNSIIDLLRSFKRDYLKLSFEISNRALMSNLFEEIKQVKNGIKSLPNSIIEMKSLNNSYTPAQEPEFKSEVQEEFEKYIEENLDKADVPWIDDIPVKTKENEIKSVLINDICQNDISNLESLLLSLTTESYPVNKLRSLFSQYFSNNFDSLPDISEVDLKSIHYYSKLIFMSSVQKYSKNIQPIPTSVPILKYNPTNTSSDNIDLAYDLLMITMYIRLMKTKLESKVQDSSLNKSLLYLILRNFTDVFTFSFLDNKSHDIIINSIIDRFKYFNSNGFFKKFEEILNQYNLVNVSEIEMKHFLKESIIKVVGANKTQCISDLHTKDYDNNKVRIPYLNELSLDEINKIIKNEIHFEDKEETPKEVSTDSSCWVSSILEAE